MNKNANVYLRPPSRLSLLGEARTAIDLGRMLLPLAAASLTAPRSPVTRDIIVVPGFGSDDRYTAPLRHYLNRQGHRAEGWGLGRNLAGTDLSHTLDDLHPRWSFERRDDYHGEAGVPYLCDALIARIEARYRDTGRPFTLIGWSLGGYLAREAARDLPDVVSAVITLGSPTVGGPKYTAAAPFFRRKGLDLDWIEDEITKRESRPIRQPITAIVSKSDAIVSWQAALDQYSPNVRHIEVSAAHLGMGFNPTIWRHIDAALAGAGGLVVAPPTVDSPRSVGVR
jgi:pimeloyl-ACP methyl ester carboxylesterase